MNEIIVEVRGGVVDVVQKPKSVIMILEDYDNDPMSECEWSRDNEVREGISNE
jgi:hypothetical protein